MKSKIIIGEITTKSKKRKRNRNILQEHVKEKDHRKGANPTNPRLKSTNLYNWYCTRNHERNKKTRNL